jgi:hypothetical protein
MQNMQEITIIKSGSWVDIDLGIESHRTYQSEAHIFEVRATYSQEEVGFSLGFPTSWQLETGDSGQVMPAMYSGAMAISSAGDCSNTFLSLLGELWGSPEPSRMAELTELGAVVLKGNPINVLTEPISIKVFFGALEDSNQPYAEMYLNIDYPQRKVEFHEKDPDYRTNIFLCLRDHN